MQVLLGSIISAFNQNIMLKYHLNKGKIIRHFVIKSMTSCMKLRQNLQKKPNYVKIKQGKNPKGLKKNEKCSGKRHLNNY